MTRFACFLALAAIAGCSDPGTTPATDSGVLDAARDAATIDAGPRDASDVGRDGGLSETDAGIDGGESDRDAGEIETDAGPPPPDAPVRDAGPPVACTSDSDCAPTGFCRDTADGRRECHPYLPEGGACGGFRPPFSEERCSPFVDPENTCAETNPLIADAPGRCAVVVTIEELESDPDRYDGHVVAIMTSWGSTGALACTRRACTPEMPCCNTCAGAFALYDDQAAMEGGGPSVGLISPEGTEARCTGDECSQTCAPYPRDATYRVIGRFDATTNRIAADAVVPLT